MNISKFATPIATLKDSTGEVFVTSDPQRQKWERIYPGQKLYPGQVLKVTPRDKCAWVKCYKHSTPTLIMGTLREWSVKGNCP